MIYLLAKYTLLFLLAAALGFVLGYWFSRRNFEDVSESYEDLRKANARSDDKQWSRLWDQLSMLPEPKETDLSGVLQGIDGVQAAIGQLPAPAPVDLKPIQARLDSLVETVRNIPRPPTPLPVDLEPLRKELRSLREDISRIPVVETQTADLSPITTSIDLVREQLKAFSPSQPVDLQPVDQRLTSIERTLEQIGKRVAGPRAVPQRAPSTAAPLRPIREQPRVLSAALYGKKDDLKLISGVGPKLESLLNKNGVYYFWQVAGWNRRDIDAIDERLEAFKGRITRDNWVDQARQLKQQPSAARMPENIE